MRFCSLPLLDRALAWLSVAVTFLTWLVVIWFFPDLPSLVPSHFDFVGRPDAYHATSFWVVAVPAVIQIVVGLLTVWIYHHPHDVNIPGPLTVLELPEPWRGSVCQQIRYLVLSLQALVTVIMAQITFATVSIALGYAARLNVVVVGGLLIAILVVLIVTTHRIYRLSVRGAAQPRSGLVKQSTDQTGLR